MKIPYHWPVRIVARKLRTSEAKIYRDVARGTFPITPRSVRGAFFFKDADAVFLLSGEV